MKVAIACDDAGLEYKLAIKEYLESRGLEVVDFGLNEHNRTADYPDYGIPASRAVASGECDRGVLICGTGIGMSLCANKFKGVRCAVCSDAYTAEATRQHNDANVIAFGARVIPLDKALELVKTFLDTPFSGVDRHARRLGKIAALEEENFK